MENTWSEDETDTGTTTEANEPIEVDHDVSHEASENKEQGKFQSCWASLYTWLIILPIMGVFRASGTQLCPYFIN
jgi:hypothetical protein